MKQLSQRVKTGIEGLDHILGGGLPRDRVYLIDGDPGVGKTTLALQFLFEGIRNKETCLYITLSESRDELDSIAESHGWSLDKLHMYELSAEQTHQLGRENTLFDSSAVDLQEVVAVLLKEVERVRPIRVVFDSLSEIRLMAGSPVRFRRQMLALKYFFIGRGCTVLLLDDQGGSQKQDVDVRSLAHGVIDMEVESTGYGADRRRLRVAKVRGSTFRSGRHDYAIHRGGLTVFPRLVAAEHRSDLVAEPLKSGIEGLDDLLGGGIDRSTTTLIIGPTGVGKSSIALQFAGAAASAGEKAAIFLFEERIPTLRARGRVLHPDLVRFLDEKRIMASQFDPAEMAPDEFSHRVQEAVEKYDAKVVVIDSINGYFNAMPDARHLNLQMHELLSYLAEKGVATVITVAQTGVMGPVTAPVDLSYLSDTTILLRHFEVHGCVRKAVSVLKKRSGWHENTLRELSFGKHGLVVGEALVDFRGVLTGVPAYAGKLEALSGETERVR